MQAWDEKPVQEPSNIVYDSIEQRNPARATPGYALVNGEIVTNTGEPVDLAELVNHKNALKAVLTPYTTRNMSNYAYSRSNTKQLAELKKQDPQAYQQKMQELTEKYANMVDVIQAYSDHHIGNQLGFGARSEASNDALGDNALGEYQENIPSIIPKIRQQPK